MRLPDVPSFVSELATPVLRLGVTGLARSGKTVFITALVRALTEGHAQPAIARLERVPGLVVRLDPQPDDDVPRFPYETALQALASDTPTWPDSTRSISQLRLTLEWDSGRLPARFSGGRQRLHVDILDYPGEWLGDLSLLDLDFQRWSARASDGLQIPVRASAARPFLEFLAQAPWAGQAPEQVALAGAALYTRYLKDSRVQDPSLSTLTPGRFLLPGDLEGTPLVTFFPWPATQGDTVLSKLMAARFESYKDKAVRPFLERHFSRLDRQIVLVDVLSALNGGAETLAELERTLEEVLRAFRPGRNSWLWRLAGRRRIDRILFGAAKADLLHHTSHARLERVLEKAVSRASRRVEDSGAGQGFLALAALKATVDVETARDGTIYHCLRGVPEPGEIVLGRRFDGKRPAVVFPGAIPDDPLDAFDATISAAGRYRFVRFCPPRIDTREAMGQASAWPHLGLDDAVAYLIGDKLP